MTTRLITTLDESFISLDDLRQSPVYESDDDLNYIITALKTFKAYSVHVERIFGMKIPDNMGIAFDNELVHKTALANAWYNPKSGGKLFNGVRNPGKYSGQYAVSMSLSWLRTIPKEAYNDTIPHELAHLVVEDKGLNTPGGHGAAWVHAMKLLGIQNPHSKFQAKGYEPVMKRQLELYKQFHV